MIRCSDPTFRSTVSTKTNQVEISLQAVEEFLLDNQLVLTSGRIHLLLELGDAASTDSNVSDDVTGLQLYKQLHLR